MSQPITLVILSADAESMRELRDALLTSGRTRVVATCESVEQMYADVLRLQPAAALIALGANAEQETALVKRLTAATPATALITAARDASPALILNSLRAGAREFLPLPVNADELKTVLERTEAFCSGQRKAARKQGRVIAVFSSKGGSGVSFIATNLAASLEKPTLLTDLNLQAGDLDSFLNAEPRYSIADVVKNRQRLDEALLSSFVTPHSAHLALLAAPLEAHEADDITPDHIFEVLHTLRESYDYVVLDLQHIFDSITIAALDQADDIVLLFTLDIPGIRNTKRALKIFERIRYPREKIHLVINRWSKQIDVELQKVEHHLGAQVIGFVPNDYKKVMDSINLGQPLVHTDPASKISIEVKRIATLVTSGGQTPNAAQRRKGLFKSLFNRQTAPAPLELSTRLDEV